jgi:hypothetical protein
MVDFCIWTLEKDGLHVPPFDQHAEGDGPLRALGFDAQSWQAWLMEVIKAQYAQQELYKKRPGATDPFDFVQLPDPHAYMLPEAHNPPMVWKGDAAIGQQLETLWKIYGPISNERRRWEIPLTTGWRKARQKGRKRLFDKLRPYHHLLPLLNIYLVSYPQPLAYLIFPTTIIISASDDQPSQDDFDERVLQAAAAFTANTVARRRIHSTYTSASNTQENQPVPLYKTYPRKPVQSAIPRYQIEVSVTAKDEFQQLMLNHLKREHNLIQNEPDLATVRFLREKTIPGWHLHYISFKNMDGETVQRMFIFQQQKDGSWRIKQGGSGGVVQNTSANFPFFVPVRDHPIIRLSGGKSSSSRRNNESKQYEFTAYGEVVDNGFDVTRVRLLDEHGQIFEDTVQEDKLVFFACVQDRDVQWPMQVELYNRIGQLVWQEEVFNFRHSPWFNNKHA